MATPRNLVNLSAVGKDYAARTILDGVTLGIADGDRIGVVGGNGQGKSTLLELIAGVETPDRGQVTHLGGLRVGVLDQADALDSERTVREVLIGQRADHEWAGDREFRGVLDGLLGGVGLERFSAGLETTVGGLSGGERRRVALALTLLDHPDLLLLDEPTNHLDVEVITWLAAHLAARSGAMLIVTHDRWFLDAVCTQTWEVADGTVHQYEGGYAAYVLARAERDRQASAREDRRRQLMRKELAWLRRGPPARTSKPKFRIEAANALIADEPPVRDSTELLAFASSRLGDKVLEAEHVSYTYPGRADSGARANGAGSGAQANGAGSGARANGAGSGARANGAGGGQPTINDVTWLLGPGERIALVGTNGSGKSTLLRLLAGEIEPSAGEVARGQTVRLGHLSQGAEEIPGHRTVIAAVEEVRRRATLAGGEELTAGKLVERFGFRGERARTQVKDLSGGERRRLTLMRLLMGEPNVLLLDEPTNDLDIETLTALEDLLDHWPGTLVVVSHDRYFIERVTDNVYALDGIGGIRHLPGGVDQYLAELEAPRSAQGQAGAFAGPAGPADPRSSRGGGNRSAGGAGSTGGAGGAGGTGGAGGAGDAGSAGGARKPGAAIRSARKEVARLEREIERHSARESELHAQMAASNADHMRLNELTAELQRVAGERAALESEWLDVAELLEG